MLFNWLLTKATCHVCGLDKELTKLSKKDAATLVLVEVCSYSNTPFSLRLKTVTLTLTLDPQTYYRCKWRCRIGATKLPWSTRWEVTHFSLEISSGTEVEVGNLSFKNLSFALVLNDTHVQLCLRVAEAAKLHSWMLNLDKQQYLPVTWLMRRREQWVLMKPSCPVLKRTKE